MINQRSGEEFYENYQRMNRLAHSMDDNLRYMLEQSAVEKDHELEQDFYRELMDKYAELLNTLNEKIEEITLLSITDPLTQVFNRMKVGEELKREVGRAKRYATPVTLIMFDIDHFKAVNDTYGHDMGDAVLIEFTRRVSSGLRSTDIFGRWGGEEFLLILPETSEEGAVVLAEKLRERVAAEPFDIVGEVTCSIGVSVICDDDDEQTLLKRADLGLYRAKESGRNRVEVVSYEE